MNFGLSGKNYDKKREELAFAQKTVKDMLSLDGWKVIETDFKKEISNLYKNLLYIKEKDLQEAQLKVTLMASMIGRIYELAGLEWTWDGYKDLRETMTSDKSEEEKRYEKYLETLNQGVAYGRDN